MKYLVFGFVRKIVKIFFSQAKLKSVFLLSLILGLGITFSLNNYLQYQNQNRNPSTANKINITKYDSIDPVMLLQKIKQQDNDFVLIDIRSSKEFNLGHIVGAINIPAYVKPQDNIKSRAKDHEFISKFYNYKSKHIIIYSYWQDSQITSDVISLLLKNGYSVKKLSVSWYEFKNNPFSWMPGNDMGVFSIDQFLEGKLYTK